MNKYRNLRAKIDALIDKEMPDKLTYEVVKKLEITDELENSIDCDDEYYDLLNDEQAEKLTDLIYDFYMATEEPLHIYKLVNSTLREVYKRGGYENFKLAYFSKEQSTIEENIIQGSIVWKENLIGE